jgi:N-acylneuraminate cytidylyltransferase
VRGGSKRLPRKNVKMFCGHPLMAWAITQAKCSKNIDEVYVTTDDDEMEQIALKYGAKVIRRPYWEDADAASANRPIYHAVKKIKEEHPELDTFIYLMATDPLNKPDDLDKAIDMFYKIGADTLSPFIKQRETYIYKVTSNSMVRLILADNKYHYGTMSGGWCVTTPEWFINYYESLPSDLDSVLVNPEVWPSIETYFYPLEYWQYADVDTQEEFEFGELLMEHYILKGQGMKVYEDYRDSWQNTEIENNEDEILNKVSKHFGNINQQ